MFFLEFCLSIFPFLVNLNKEALLKVSFKNIDWFQIWPFSKTTTFSKKGLKNQQFFRAFQLVYCLFLYSQWLLIHRGKRLNFTAIKSQSATTVLQNCKTIFKVDFSFQTSVYFFRKLFLKKTISEVGERHLLAHYIFFIGCLNGRLYRHREGVPFFRA